VRGVALKLLKKQPIYEREKPRSVVDNLVGKLVREVETYPTEEDGTGKHRGPGGGNPKREGGFLTIKG